MSYRDTDPDREFELYLKDFQRRQEETIRKRYRMPLDADALARADADVTALADALAEIRTRRAVRIARATTAIEAETDATRKTALTELLDLYRRNPTADEQAHQSADAALLVLIGDDLVSELFHALPKWYT